MANDTDREHAIRTVDDQCRLSEEQITTYKEQGFLHLKGVLDENDVEALQADTEWLLDEFGSSVQVFSQVLSGEESISEEELQNMDLETGYDLESKSTRYRDLVLDPRIVTPITDLLGPNVEFVFSSLHVKPPKTGNPFPMHQDSNFYWHETDDVVVALVHVDDAPSETGPLRFIERSHEDGIISEERGEALSADEYPIEESTEVPAAAGDVILFNYHTIHGSKLNRSDCLRPIVRLVYRDSANEQLGGRASDKIPLRVTNEDTTGS